MRGGCSRHAGPALASRGGVRVAVAWLKKLGGQRDSPQILPLRIEVGASHMGVRFGLECRHSVGRRGGWSVDEMGNAEDIYEWDTFYFVSV